MRIAILLLLTLNSFGHDSLNIQLQSRIYEIYKSDQECREKLRDFHNNELDTNEYNLSGIEFEIRKTDSLNYFELKDIVDEYGYPGFDIVGEDYSNSFWNIIQHQDNNLGFQKEVLKKMKIECNRNNASKLYYAYLIDRVKVNSGEMQIYGTQMQLNLDSTSYEPKPIIELEKLDKRRMEVGLKPISEYITTMNTRYAGTLNNQ
jgi:hypothetical protein